MLAGGGFALGQIYRVSAATESFPTISPLIPGDLIA